MPLNYFQVAFSNPSGQPRSGKQVNCAMGYAVNGPSKPTRQTFLPTLPYLGIDPLQQDPASPTAILLGTKHAARLNISE